MIPKRKHGFEHFFGSSKDAPQDSAPDSPGADAPPSPDASAPESPEAPPRPAAEKLAAEERNARIRLQADFENYKKRIERERAEDRARSTAAVLESFLPVLDAFERALTTQADPSGESYRRGFELIYRQLLDSLARQGLTRIESVGQHFDPRIHEAVDRIPTTEFPEGIIVEELSPGYRLGDKLLRPAMVRVAYRPATGSAGAND